MKPHIKIYTDFYDIGEQDYCKCEVKGCIKKAVDVHHIKFRSQGGNNKIDNLIGLCREHHDKAHSDKEFNNQLKELKSKEFNND